MMYLFCPSDTFHRLAQDRFTDKKTSLNRSLKSPLFVYHFRDMTQIKSKEDPVANEPQDKKNLDDFSREELEHFIHEKEKIRQIVGQIGGKPTLFSKVVNIAMLVFILATLIAAPFVPKELELPAVEVGLVLLSIKIFMFLHNEAKVIHFQFWMLSSLEWRMNDIAKRLTRMDAQLKRVAEDIETLGDRDDDD